jgi:type IV fimbrial biogenesis protein FimT
MGTRNGSRGVTLLELCFGISIVAVLAGIATPGFHSAIRSAAMRSAAFELAAGLQQARGSSILEGRTGVFCLSDTAGNCLAGQESARAWATFLEGDVSRPLGGRSLPQGLRLRATRSRLQFWPHARAGATGTLTICDERGIAGPRAIVVSQVGRVRMAEAAPGACDP